MKPKRDVHTSLVDLIAYRLQADGFTYIEKEKEYGECVLGEVDVLGVKYNNIFIFECKSNDNPKLIKHGLEQLIRSKGYYQRNCPDYKIKQFIVYYNKTGEPVCQYIK